MRAKARPAKLAWGERIDPQTVIARSNKPFSVYTITGVYKVLISGLMCVWPQHVGLHRVCTSEKTAEEHGEEEETRAGLPSPADTNQYAEDEEVGQH